MRDDRGGGFGRPPLSIAPAGIEPTSPFAALNSAPRSCRSDPHTGTSPRDRRREHTLAGGRQGDRGATHDSRPNGHTIREPFVQAIGLQPQLAPNGDPLHCERHSKEQTTLHRPVQQHAATVIGETEAPPRADLPQRVTGEFDAFLECGILAHGFLRVRCGDCGHDKLVAFSCKRRGFARRGEPGESRKRWCPESSRATCSGRLDARLPGPTPRHGRSAQRHGGLSYRALRRHPTPAVACSSHSEDRV
jgi:Transposase zinc-binding domain